MDHEVQILSIKNVYFNLSVYYSAARLYMYTVLPESLTRVLFLHNFAVGVGPRKLRSQNFCAREKFDQVELVATCMWCDLLDAVELLYHTHLSPFLTSS